MPAPKHGAASAITWQPPMALAFAAISLLLRALLQIGLVTHRAAGEVTRYSALEAGSLMLGFIVGVGIIFTTDLGAAGIFMGLAIGSGVALIVDLPVMLRRAARGRRQMVRARAYAKFGAPVSASLVFEQLLSVGDRFLIAAFLGQGAVGMYAAGYGLADRLLDIIFIWFGAAVWPLTIKALESQGPEAAREVAGRAAGLAFTLKRRTTSMAVIMAGAAVLNLGLNLVFIPVFGIAGAAAATVIAYFLSLLVCAWLGRKYFPLPLPWNDWIRAAAATGLMAVAVWTLPAIESAWLMLAAQAMTGALVYVASALALNIADCRSWLADARALIKPAGAQS